MSTLMPATSHETSAVYDEALAFMQHLYDEVGAGRPIPGASVFALVEKLLQVLEADGRVLLSLTAQVPVKHPMASHVVNTCILAAATARGLGYDPAMVREASTAALLHDVGLAKIINHQRGNELEYSEMRRHSYQTLELLDHIPELSRLTLYLTPIAQPAHEAAQDVVLHHAHERTGREDELSKVIRLADLYEALSHPRADGVPLAFAAVKTVLTTQKLFEPRLMKALFDQVGIYPVGTWVQLSSGDIGLVTGIQPGLPLRPHVMLFYDRDNRKLSNPREVNLQEHATIFIRRNLDGEPHLRES